VSYTTAVRSELQRTADAAAMAAASQLAANVQNYEDLVRAMAQEFATRNETAGGGITLSAGDVELGRAVQEDDGRYSFEAGAEPVDAVRVTVRRAQDSAEGPVTLFFGAALGVSSVELSASATAMLVPRDIAVVVDLSASMGYDSQLRHESMTNINIREVWEDLGSRTFGNMSTFHASASVMPSYSSSYSNTYIIGKLGLTNVPYPYPSGSWSDYVTYVKNLSSNTAYKNKYGLRTFTNYLLEKKYGASQTPDLKNTRQQPTHAVKQAVEELCDYLTEMDTDDYLSIHYYSDSAWTGVTLTDSYPAIVSNVYAQSAGNYGTYTNIYAGMNSAVNELLSDRARPNAKKVIFLMTDGNPNRPSTGDPIALALASADTARVKHIQVHTISFGADSNQTLMEDMAGTGKGSTYYVASPDIAQYTEDLRQVFRALGGKRPVRLIQ
jgi:hypothetical protein